MEPRVKYFSNNDMSIGVNLQRAEIVMNSYNSNVATSDINDILEYYNITKFFDNNLYLDSWDIETKNYLDSVSKQFKATIGRFFHRVNGDNFTALYDQVERTYHEDFFEALSAYKATERILDTQISSFIESHKSALLLMLKHQSITNKFGETITYHLTHNIEYSECVIRHYYPQRSSFLSVKTFFPSQFGKEEVESVVRKYVDWESANINYLEFISSRKKAGNYPIDCHVRFKAHQRVQRFWEEHFKNGKSGVKYGTEIIISDQEEVFTESAGKTPFVRRQVFSKKWISSNLDQATLLNNFIYLFRYVDSHCRCLFPSNPNDLGIIEQLSGIHGMDDYRTGVSFNSKNMCSSLQMHAYQAELRKHNIEIESLFKWFFEEYLKNEFGICNFVYCTPSSQSSTLERILLIASQLDAVLKQFRMYKDDGEIDRALFEFSSEAFLIVDTPSTIKNKYLYPHGEVITRAISDLFSDQNNLSYTEKTGSAYSCFMQILEHERITINDYHRCFHSELQWLIDQGFIIESSDKTLKTDQTLASLLFDLHQNGCIVFPYCSPIEKKILEEMLSQGYLYSESTLFTHQEQEYLDYMLNVHQFANGPELRNKYVHGNFPLNEDIHKKDYIELLKIMTLIIIKINEEFCLGDSSINLVEIV